MLYEAVGPSVQAVSSFRCAFNFAKLEHQPFRLVCSLRTPSFLSQRCTPGTLLLARRFLCRGENCVPSPPPKIMPPPTLLSNDFARDAEFNCFGCSPRNPHGLKLEFYKGDHGSVFTTFKPGKVHESFPGITHGGLLAVLIGK